MPEPKSPHVLVQFAADDVTQHDRQRQQQGRNIASREQAYAENLPSDSKHLGRSIKIPGNLRANAF